MAKRFPGLPDDVSSIRELAERYLVQDPAMSVQTMQQRLRETFQIEVGYSTLGNIRSNYRCRMGLAALGPGGAKRKYERKKVKAESNGHAVVSMPSRPTENLSMDTLRQFVDAVKAVGGRENAQALLSLFGG